MTFLQSAKLRKCPGLAPVLANYRELASGQIFQGSPRNLL